MHGLGHCSTLLLVTIPLQDVTCTGASATTQTGLEMWLGALLGALGAHNAHTHTQCASSVGLSVSLLGSTRL